MCDQAKRASEHLRNHHFSSNLCYSIVLYSSNDMLKWNMRASEASERLRNCDFPWIWFNFFVIYSDFFEFPDFLNNSFSFLKFPWNSLNFCFGIPWKIPWGVQNSLDFVKKEISLKVSTGIPAHPKVKISDPLLLFAYHSEANNTCKVYGSKIIIGDFVKASQYSW